MPFPPSGACIRLCRNSHSENSARGDKEGSVPTSQSDYKTSTATGSNGAALLDCSVMQGNKKRGGRRILKPGARP